MKKKLKRLSHNRSKRNRRNNNLSKQTIKKKNYRLPNKTINPINNNQINQKNKFNHHQNKKETPTLAVMKKAMTPKRKFWNKRRRKTWSWKRNCRRSKRSSERFWWQRSKGGCMTKLISQTKRKRILLLSSRRSLRIYKNQKHINELLIINCNTQNNVNEVKYQY